MNTVFEALDQEVREHFRVHRVLSDDRGITIHHVSGDLHMAVIRFADHGGTVYIDCYRLDRRCQERHELADPHSIEKILGFVTRHMNYEISHDNYN